MFVCVYILNVCVCVCVAPARPWGYRQLGDSADGITYDMWVTEWVCVCMCVYVCVCVCASQSIWAPLWPTGAPSAHCGPLGSQRDDREWERAARPAYLHSLSPQPTLTKHAIFLYNVMIVKGFFVALQYKVELFFFVEDFFIKCNLVEMFFFSLKPHFVLKL